MNKFNINTQAQNAIVKMSKNFDDDSYTFPWANYRKRFTVVSASKFFISVMLDQQQLADRAWTAGNHLVNEHFPTETIWEEIKDTHLNTLKSILSKGFNVSQDTTIYTGSYAQRNVNKFPNWLKDNAKIINVKYRGDPRRIWNVQPKEVEVIYNRFKEFNGISDALAKMAQFILVRDYGVAGGWRSRKFLKAKPDKHVCQVVKRLGISPSEKPRDAIKAIDYLNHDSQADIDAVLFNVGRNHCYLSAPECKKCPFDNICFKRL